MPRLTIKVTNPNEQLGQTDKCCAAKILVVYRMVGCLIMQINLSILKVNQNVIPLKDYQS